MKLVNIFNDNRTIYLFLRNEKGELEIKEVNDFFPYYYEINKEGNCKSFDGKNLQKIYANAPYDVVKQRSNNAYEADIMFSKRYLIDKVDTLEKCPVKIAYIDIEIKAPELPNPNDPKYPITCISVGNSFTRKIKTFWIKDYKTEFEMTDAFINYMKEEQFDLWLSWNVQFDYNYMYARIPEFDIKLSPIGKNRYGDGEVYYPAGLSVVDYLGWFKKVTLNREGSYALDDVAKKHLKEKAWKETDFNEISEDIKEKNINDVRRMTKIEDKFKIVEFFDEIRRLSKVEWEDMLWNSRVIDSLMLMEAKEDKVALPMKPAEYRGTLEDKVDYKAGFREVYKKGFGEGYSAYDLSSAYPSMMLDFCLDSSNIRKNKEENTIKIENTYFKQNSNTIIPKVAKKLMIKKQLIKDKLEKAPTDSKEFKDLKILYKAIKSLVNSLYGVCALRFFRVYDPRCASATTYLVRDLLKYVIDELKNLGYEVIYVDTDGILVDTKENITDLLNSLVVKWYEKYGKEKVNTEFSYEGIFKNIIILALCRYEGELLKPNGEVELKRVGLEIKRKDSTVFLKEFQKELLTKIRHKEPKEKVIDWIKEEIKNIRNQPLENIAVPCKLSRAPEDYKNEPIFARALKYSKKINPGYDKRIGEKYFYIYTKPFGYETKNKEKDVIMTYDKNGNERGYKNLTEKRLEKAVEEILPNADIKNIEVRDSIINELQSEGIMKTEVQEQKGKKKNVLAFDEKNKNFIDKEQIDWKLMTQRNILNKVEVIFKSMNWSMKEI